MKIEANDLCKIYGSGENRVTALSHASLSLSDGDFLSIWGLPAVVKAHCCTCCLVWTVPLPAVLAMTAEIFTGLRTGSFLTSAGGVLDLFSRSFICFLC